MRDWGGGDWRGGRLAGGGLGGRPGERMGGHDWGATIGGGTMGGHSGGPQWGLSFSNSLYLLGDGADAGVACDSDGNTGGEAGHSAAEPRAEVRIPGELRVCHLA